MTITTWILLSFWAVAGTTIVVGRILLWLSGPPPGRRLGATIHTQPVLSRPEPCPRCSFEAFRLGALSHCSLLDSSGRHSSGWLLTGSCTACGARLQRWDDRPWEPDTEPVPHPEAPQPEPSPWQTRYISDPPERSAILILDDSADRFRAFRAAVDPEIQIVWWRDAHQMIRDLPRYLRFASVVSLDHDLYPQPGAADPGDGLLVARHLATLPPACPVIIHSSNSEQASLMRSELELAGWSCSTVMPFGDRWTHEWAMLTIERMRPGDVREREQQPTA